MAIVDAVLARVVEQASELLHAPKVGLAVIEPDPGGPILQFVATHGLSGQFTQRIRPSHWRDGTTAIAIHERRPVWSEDLLNDPAIDLTAATRGAVEAEGYRAVLSVPLLAGDRTLGALVLYRDEVGPFTPEAVELAQVFAAQAAVAIENAQLYREAESRASRLRALSALTQLIVSASASGAVFQALAEAATELLGARLARVWVEDPERRVVRVEGHAGTAVPPTVELPYGEGIVGAVIAGREPKYGRDIQANPLLMDRGHAEGLGLHAYAALPLVAGDRVMGVLMLVFAERRDFAADEVEVMRLLADHAGIAIRLSQLYREAERRRREAESALEQVARSQATIVQHERLRALGEMAAGVAHDFNNMLAVIVGRAELLLAKTDDPTLVRGLQDIRRAAANGASTVRRIQNFTGTRRARAPVRVALDDVVRDVVQLTRVRWKDEAERRGVPYEVVVEGSAPAVAGHADELREVLTNLLNNALDAMPDGGRCTFRLGAERATATVEVADTGEGMAPEVAARIFEPFFTTKGPKGSGLGLSVSWGIVNANGGTITVESAPGRGTRLTVRLPVPAVLPDDTADAIAAEAARHARILVIDDDENVRGVLGDMLAELGHVVTEADSGAAGIARCAAEPFDLVITDLSMPGMSGWEVAAALGAAHPGLAVGIVTGWGEQVDPEQAARHHLHFVLAKPFRFEDVIAAVGAVVGA